MEVAPVVRNGVRGEEGCWIRGAEGVWKRCGSPGKRTALSCGDLGIPLSCPAGGGNDFVLLERCKVSLVRGGVYHGFLTGIFQALGWGSLTWVVCTVLRLQICARRFRRKLVASG